MVAYYNVGDRILINDKDIGIIISVYRQNDRYYVRYLESYNTQGTNVDTWVHHNSIKIDVQYYREERLKKILNGVR